MDSTIRVASKKHWGRSEGSGDGPESHLLHGERAQVTTATRKRHHVPAHVCSHRRNAGANATATAADAATALLTATAAIAAANAAAADAAHLASAANRRASIDQSDGYGRGSSGSGQKL